MELSHQASDLETHLCESLEESGEDLVRGDEHVEETLNRILSLHRDAMARDPQNGKIAAMFASFVVRNFLNDFREQRKEGFQNPLEKEVQKAFRIAEKDAEARMICIGERAVFLFLIQNDLQQAFLAFEEATSSDNQELVSVDALYHFGVFLDKAGDPERAAEMYRNALLRNPRHAECLNNLASLIIENCFVLDEDDDSRNGIDEINVSSIGTLGEARDLLEMAQQISPGFPAYNLACLFAKSFDQHECEKWIWEALKTGGILPGTKLSEDPDFGSVVNEFWFRYIENAIDALPDTLFLDPENHQNLQNELMRMHRSLNHQRMDVDIKLSNRYARISKQANGLPGRTTGYEFWDSSFVLLRKLREELMQRKVSGLPAARVLDLSAGCGLIGISLALEGALVSMTDIGEAQLKLMEENCSRNGLNPCVYPNFMELEQPRSTQQVSICNLFWGEAISNQSDQKNNAKSPRFHHFDYIIASDLLYIAIRDRIETEFCSTIMNLIQENEIFPSLFIGFEQRAQDQEQAILNDLQTNLATVRSDLPWVEFLCNYDSENDELHHDEEPDQEFSGMELMFHEKSKIRVIRWN